MAGKRSRNKKRPNNREPSQLRLSDLLDCSSVPRLHRFDCIVVNSSAGKDSQTALRQIVRLADGQSVSRDRIVVSHQDLGRMEWPGTKELAAKQAAHYSLRFEVVARRKADGNGEELLDYVRRRGKWPDSKNRFCTSDFKRGPGARVLTMVAKEARAAGQSQPLIMNVFGFRAAESPARKRKQPFGPNQFSRPSSEKWDYLPIHDWSEEEVWHDIRDSGVPYHPAYDLGMPRLSCTFCIFAPRAALMTAGKARPDLLDEFVQLEREIGHDFQHGKPLAEVQAAINRGDDPGECHGARMPVLQSNDQDQAAEKEL